MTSSAVGLRAVAAGKVRLELTHVPLADVAAMINENYGRKVLSIAELDAHAKQLSGYIVLDPSRLAQRLALS